MFKPGDCIRRKGGQLLYEVLVTEEDGAMYVSSEKGLARLIHPEYFELVGPAQVVPSYMELFL